ncbi:MAG TPA: alpha/beta fold hydrolase [Polyangiaceae bacterium]|nr:alpha/beta fold hydrolase [Polyangiaceae bacterium]
MGVTVLLVLLGVVAAFYVGAFGYLGVTFALMRPHAEPRPLPSAARSFLFELLCVALVQPWLPFFYFVGRRMGGAPGGVPIVFVHGYFQNRVDFVYLARILRAAGLGPLFAINYPFLASVKDNAARLARFCARVRAETGAAHVDLVCHSLGGLVALELVRQDPAHVRRCVTVASPHAGVVFRGPILGASGRDLRAGSELVRQLGASRAAVPVLSIYSSHDNVVHPKLTSALAARGGEDVEVAHFGHFGILFSRTVAAHIVAFLRPEEAPAGLARAEVDVAPATPATRVVERGDEAAEAAEGDDADEPGRALSGSPPPP